MRVLLVGAGAVGQVYGRHLQLAGAQLAYYVRPKYVEAVRAGLTLYPFTRGLRGAPPRQGVRLDDLEVLSSPEQVAACEWDQVWLSIPATGLRGAWLAPFLAAIGSATLVGLTPGLEDRAHLLAAGLDEAQLVRGQITFMAWQAPLPGQSPSTYPAPGVAYWFPPLSPSSFAGPPARVDAVVASLRAGGCPARASTGTAAAVDGSVALSLPLMAALQLAGWSLRALRRGPQLALGLAAGREAMVIAGRYRGRGFGLLAPLFLRPWLLRPLIALAPCFVPFDLEAFLAWHFSKVGAQTHAALETYLERASTGGETLEHGALRQLATALAASERPPPAALQA